MAGLAGALRNWLAPMVDPLAYLEPHLQAVPTPSPQAEALLKRLHLHLRQRLRTSVLGDQRSLLRGQGLDFAELRQYVPGDDIRKIDWNVFARTLTPHIKEFHEEKQFTAWLYVDLTPSMFFGQLKTKAEQAIELGGLLGLLLKNHRLGAVLATGTGVEILEPRTGQAHLQRIVQRMLEMKAQEQSQVREIPPDFQHAQFERLEHLVGRGASVFFLSDYTSLNEDWRRPLGELGQRASLFHLLLGDAAEAAPPPAGWPLFDPESGRTISVTPSQQATYLEALNGHMRQLHGWLETSGTVVHAQTGEDPVDILLRLLRRPV